VGGAFLVGNACLLMFDTSVFLGQYKYKGGSLYFMGMRESIKRQQHWEP